jgi:glutathione S-transferase
MVNFCLTSPLMFGGRDDLPNVGSYVERVSNRPAYIKAMQIAGPAAVPPVGT